MNTALDPKHALRKPSDTSPEAIDTDDSAPAPTDDEMDEVMSPYLSIDSFTIDDRTFPIKISSIKTQKRMLKSMDSIAELMKSLDVAEIAKGYRDRTLAALDSGDTDDASSMFELIQDIVQRGGISNILNTLLDLFVGVVYAICQSEDPNVERDWVEENLEGVAQAQEIFFAQLEKDSIGGRVIDFLQSATRAVMGV